MNFLYLKVPIAKHVHDQSREFEDNIDRLLKENGVGSVAGWGDSLGEALATGIRPVAFTRIDVDVTDLISAIALLHANLASLGAPSGTEIHSTFDQRRRKDILADSMWVVDQTA
ncbi:MAG: hypothetical protein QFF03_21050 [Pseudomonadota bacterium]|nr:hypothetical protein [Pseudomonadota bacterium]